jgi:protein gp37
MGAETKIEWTHHTFNPWIGCTPVHTGCKNCYAEAQNLRWKYNGGTWGKGEPRKVTSASSWKQPLKWAREAAKAGERRRVFCASLADVLDLEAPPDAQARLWDLIRETVVVKPVRYLEPQDLQRFGGLDWLLLTKRPERWQIIPSDVRPLVWLGTSISDQLTADVWGPRLMRAQGFAKRFLSIEPQVGPIDLDPMLPGAFTVGTSGLDWVICGGESGPNARPFDLVWAYSLREQCRASPFSASSSGPARCSAPCASTSSRSSRCPAGEVTSRWPASRASRSSRSRTRRAATGPSGPSACACASSPEKKGRPSLDGPKHPVPSTDRNGTRIGRRARGGSIAWRVVYESRRTTRRA